jgi:hypothetical protein
MKKLFLISFLALAIQSQAQNVGIGTPIPSYKFTVLNDGVGIAHTSSSGSVEIITQTNSSPSSGWFGTYTKVPMRIGAYQYNSISMMVNGKVGIGIDNPVSTALLEVNGDTKINGEVNRPTTGNANMVPIAYGTVSSTGVIKANSENITCVKTAVGTYEITITSENYFYLDYITTATCMPPTSTPSIISVGSVSGKLIINIYSLAGVLTDTSFSFITYKP